MPRKKNIKKKDEDFGVAQEVGDNLRFHRILLFWVLLFIGIMIFYLIFFYEKPFNPEEDVCEEWKCKSGTYYWYSENEDCNMFRVDDIKDVKRECSDWREKFFCEKCVDDWNDKCDKECECLEKISRGSVKLDYNKSPESYRIDMECNIKCFEETKSLIGECQNRCNRISGALIKEWFDCSKSREKTPCEMGEERWIERCLNVSVNGKCLAELNCEKKTIYDYSCQELKRVFYLNKCIKIPYDVKWYDVFIACYSKEQIYDAMLEKGCSI